MHLVEELNSDFLYYHLFYFAGGLDTQNFKMALNLDEELYDVNARLREIEEMCSDSDDDEADNEPSQARQVIFHYP